MSRRLATGALAASAALAIACGPGRGGAGAPEGEVRPEAAPPLPTREPFVRVGVAVGRDSVRVTSPGGVRVSDLAAGREVGASNGGGPWAFRAVDGGVAAVPPDVVGEEEAAPPAPTAGDVPAAADGAGGEVTAGAHRRLRVEALGDGGLEVEGRRYRGTLELYRVRPHGLVVVNELDMETYLLGVVPVEIGPRAPEEEAAVMAQAVAARTYAVRNLGRRDSLGFDVFGNVEDQVYGGSGTERPDATRAVRATVGEILTYRGRPVRAYYHSTGGGTTARVTDVWDLPDAPYLRRVSDRRPEDGDYCEISPRYRWEERWTPGELREAVRAGGEEHFGAEGRVGRVTSVRVLGRVPGGRIRELEVRTEGGRWVVSRNDIRFFLRTPDGRVLRSTRFDVVEGPSGGGGLVLRGRGYGHGVGMCQWGAIGRARAGQGYREILAHYYPGTEVRKAY